MKFVIYAINTITYGKVYQEKKREVKESRSKLFTSKPSLTTSQRRGIPDYSIGVKLRSKGPKNLPFRYQQIIGENAREIHDYFKMVGQFLIL